MWGLATTSSPVGPVKREYKQETVKLEKKPKQEPKKEYVEQEGSGDRGRGVGAVIVLDID